jgi:deoxyadenosine/deoxycytidine kinase
MLPDKYRYVVVEGPIGVGKTSLVQRLAQHLNAATLLEKPEENPFLAKFYQHPARYALATQLFFLLQRGNEVRELSQLDMFQQTTVADYLFDKDSLFARLNLPDAEFDLYQQIYQSLAVQAPVPDLVIYLQASVDTLLTRVHKRALRYEQNISDDYLVKLTQSYSEFFYHYDAAPVLVVNSDNLNLVGNDEHFALLLKRIQDMRSSREFFSLGG